ncbi:CaiB/BaiF CoA transferase family protein [Salaquimonas pukyongi]|uniref:CaiB/BaiF CoA transferase family protein n=1 Tax=Salaquimonas pukyongi TaxID=2712698 RepID=UPI00096BAAC2|nr:CoA transferase [Salaquimonas pukyongi]
MAEKGILSGYTVLDLSSVVLGPYASQFLGDLGAEVIKIESPEGDIMRHAGPMRSKGMGPIYLTINRNKRAVTLDLAKPEAKEILNRLIETADVFFHNIRASGIKRLGFDYDSVRAIRPDIVYVHAVGFGSGGQYEGRPAYDDLIQAVSGLAMMLPRQDGSSAPRYFPGLMADKTTALFAANALLAGLLHRERTGEGQFIEVPMMECMVAFNMVENLFGHAFVPPLGDTAYSRSVSPNRKPYATRDGYIAVMPYSDHNWQQFFTLGGMPELATDPRFATYPARTANIDELYSLSEKICAQKTTDEWMVLLTQANVPCARVHSLETVLEDRQIADTGLAEVRQHPSEGEYRAIHQPIRFSAAPCPIRREPPKQGADTEPVLEALGYSGPQIAELRKSGAVG